MIVDLKRDEKALNPIECFIRETKALKKEASEAGKASLVAYLENVLLFITYAKADSERLTWLEATPSMLNIQTEDLRLFIDKHREQEKG